MDQQEIHALLEQVAQGQRSVDEAVLALKMEPFQELGFAKVDNHRGLRQAPRRSSTARGKHPGRFTTSPPPCGRPGKKPSSSPA